MGLEMSKVKGSNDVAFQETTGVRFPCKRNIRAYQDSHPSKLLKDEIKRGVSKNILTCERFHFLSKLQDSL